MSRAQTFIANRFLQVFRVLPSDSFFPSFPSLFTACHDTYASVCWLVKAKTKRVEPRRRQPKQRRRADLRVGKWEKYKDRPTRPFSIQQQ